MRKDGTAPREHYFVWLEQVIAAHLHTLFPGMTILATHLFRVVRDADILIQELEAYDLLETMEQSMRRRRFGSVVQVLVNKATPTDIRHIFCRKTSKWSVVTSTPSMGRWASTIS